MIDYRLLPARIQAAMAIEPFHTWALPDATPWTQFYRSNEGYLLRFPGLADFQVSGNALTVHCIPAPNTEDSTLQHLYQNQVLPLVLSKQGKLVFHASAVETPNGAIAFVAESGRGKSTLAASFAVNGYRLLSDDGLVLEPADHGFQALPGHPSIRLWADSEEALITPDTKKAPTLPFTSKARLLAGEDIRFSAQPRPLRRVYFLGDGSADELTIQRLSASDALLEWLQHSFLLDVEEKPRLASHFDQLATLANQPIHYRLDYPRHFDGLPLVHQAIVEHARERSHAA